MNDYIALLALNDVFRGVLRFPTAMAWNRLEGAPRAVNFDRALRAEIADPLWMLTRQWQFGEFHGDDAGSPITAMTAWRTEEVTSLRSADGLADLAIDRTVPLEAVVEARTEPAPASLTAAERLALGRRWGKLLTDNGQVLLLDQFRTRFSFSAPDHDDPHAFPVTAHAAAAQFARALAGRGIDGGALLAQLASGSAASTGITTTPADAGRVDVLGAAFAAWAATRFVVPTPAAASPAQPGTDRWDPTRLDYSARLVAHRDGAPSALAAPQYRGGRLDWFHFDAAAPDPIDAATGPVPLTSLVVQTFLPTGIRVDGMPDSRHWAFEEGSVNLGGIRPDTTDLAKLLLVQFGLTFERDWFLLPLEVPVGSLTSVPAVVVSTVFGERFAVERGDPGEGVTASRAFELERDGDAVDRRLFVPAATPTSLESRVVESVAFVRDEVANMVWGIETVVQLDDGSSRSGREVALELRARYELTVPPVVPAPTNDADVSYRLMTTVPENWIPFLPMRIPGDPREIQLQRGAMPRMLELPGPPERVRPRTRLLREGLDESPTRRYLVAEEEVERAGTVIEARWQRTRWTDGSVILWLGERRSTGRGEASSGLEFDVLVPKPAAP